MSDATIELPNLDRTIDWSFEAFVRHHDRPDRLYFTFGKIAWQYASQHGYDNKPVEEKWKIVTQIREFLEHGDILIVRNSETLAISLIPVGETLQTFRDPVAALNRFVPMFLEDQAYRSEKTALISRLRGEIAGTRNHIEKAQARLRELEGGNNYRLWADLIMANLHRISPGTTEVTLENIYGKGQSVSLRLRKEQSPQKNAETFYRKAKNQQLEIDHLRAATSVRENELRKKEDLLARVVAAADLETVRKLRPSEKNKSVTGSPSLPYREFVHRGFRIWVGKNAESNDQLTLKYSSKDDLWLHVRDVPGSHVVIKHQAGKNFPKDVIERAAELAAYNSKRRTETLCPVTVTPKKYVRKRKGDPPGTMVVSRETVVMVTPKP